MSKALDLLSSFALSQVVFASYKIGVFDGFLNHEQDSLNIDNLILSNNLNERYTRGLVEYLVRRDVLIVAKNDDNIYVLGSMGEHLITDKWISYILYYVGGYGEILGRAADLANGSETYGDSLLRDLTWVAVGTEMMSSTSHHLSYQKVLEAVQIVETPRYTLDIGCGSGIFMRDLTLGINAEKGVGVDCSAEACNIAVLNTNDYINKFDIIQGDFLELAESGRLGGRYGTFDIITSMMIIHEYLYQGDDAVIRVLSGIFDLLSDTGIYVLLDKNTDKLDSSPKYFSEFKLAHDLTNQDLCSVNKWKYLLDKSGLAVIDEVDMPEHTGSVLFICRRVKPH